LNFEESISQRIDGMHNSYISGDTTHYCKSNLNLPEDSFITYELVTNTRNEIFLLFPGLASVTDQNENCQKF